MSDSIRDLIGRTSNDWPTEHEENGNYSVHCCACGVYCVGPKRAHQCWPCEQKGRAAWEALTPEEQAAKIQRANEIIAQIWARDEASP